MAALLSSRGARADPARDIARQEAQALADAADRTTAAGRVRFGAAGGVFERLSVDACRGEPAGRECEELLYNAAVCMQSAGEADRAIALYRQLPAGTLGNKALYRSAALQLSLTRYAEAAEGFELYAARDPKALEARSALADAAALRLGVQQTAQAEADVSRYLRTYVVRPEGAGLIVKVAAHLVDHDDAARARAILQQTHIDQTPLDLRIQGHVLLGRAIDAGSPGASAQAAAHYVIARDLWKDPHAAEATLRGAWPNDDDGAKDVRVARTLTAVAQALFALAEQRRVTEVDILTRPTFDGPATSAGVQAYVDKKLRPWAAAKARAIASVAQAYQQILDLRPVAPPSGIRAALNADAVMWASFVNDLRSGARPPILAPALEAQRRAILREHPDHRIEELLPPLRSAPAALHPADAPPVLNAS